MRRTIPPPLGRLATPKGRTRRGWWLGLGTALAALTLSAREAAVIDILPMQIVSDALFPELERAPGVYGLEGSFVKPGADPRLSLPANCPAALLVSATLLAADIPPDAPWHLDVGPKEKSKVRTYRIAPPAVGGGNLATPDPVPGPLPAGTVDRVLFWVDLGPLLRGKILAPGDRLTLRHGTAKTELTYPR